MSVPSHLGHAPPPLGGGTWPQRRGRHPRLTQGLVKAALLAAGVAALGWGLAALLDGRARPQPAPADALAQRAEQSYGKLPMRFEVNRGQTDAQVRFLSRGPRHSLFLTPREAILSLAGAPTAGGEAKEAVVRMGLVGANPRPELDGGGRLPGVTNYLTGSDARKWQTGVPSFGRVSYRAVYPGIDLVFHGRQRQLEYDFVVSPGRDPGVIGVRFEGARKLSLDRGGDLVLQTAAGPLRQRKPVLYQVVDGARRTVAGSYVIQGPKRVGFRVGAYDRSRPLTIDPVLVYSSHLGGGEQDRGFAIAVDAAGSAYVAGGARSTGFPFVNAQRTAVACPANAFYCEAFVTKLSPDGSRIVYSTYLGGGAAEDARGIAVDGDGSAYVTGITRSGDFPTTAGADDTSCGTDGACNASNDAFVAKLTPAGNGLAYSTFVGGAAGDEASDVALESGSAYVSGTTGSPDFPTTAGAFDTVCGTGGGCTDAFAVKLNAAGSDLAYSTFLGGGAGESGLGIAQEGGSAYVMGRTNSTDYPTQAPLQPANAGAGDLFVTKLSPSGGAVAYSTYLGGSGDDVPTVPIDTDVGAGIAVRAGSAYLTGGTCSSDFPTTPAPFQTDQPGCDGFVAKLSASGAALAYSTYLGGGGDEEEGRDIAVDASGGAHIAGRTGSGDFPVIDPFSPRQGAAFVARVKADGSGLENSTVFGGSLQDEAASAIEVDGTGAAYVAGHTTSYDFPNERPFQPSNSAAINQPDAFVMKLAVSDPAAPRVLAVAPRSGPDLTPVRITGRGFTGATAVRFGGVPADEFTVASDTEIAAVAPFGAGGASGAGDAAAVTVTTAGRTSPANLTSRFTYSDGAWTETDPLATGRTGHTTTLLPSGKVLVAGGEVFDPDEGAAFPVATAELFDPKSGTWSAAGPMIRIRFSHAAVLLDDGRVLLTGGTFGAGRTSEVYDPATNAFTAVSGLLTVNRFRHSATVLPSGKVLIAGGASQLASAELFDPATATSTATGRMLNGRQTHPALLLPSGKVLVAAGHDSPPNATRKSELYDPATGTWDASGDLIAPERVMHSLTALPNGTVMAAGGSSAFSGRAIGSVEVWDPSGGTWSQSPPLGLARYGHAAAALPNGRVLLTGGLTAINSLVDAAEVLDPVTLARRHGGFMKTRRGGRFGFPRPPAFAATVLSSSTTAFVADPAVCGDLCGRVLVASGTGSEERAPGPAEIYTPAPSIESVGPESGPAAGGTRVVITGTGFTHEVRAVRFGATRARSFEVDSYGRLSAVAPAHAAGAVDVTVTNAGGTTTPGGRFRFTAPPTAPTPGPAPGGGEPLAPFAGCAAGAANVVRGTAAGESLRGTAAGDRIFAGAGADLVDALAGDDCIDLGLGADRGEGRAGRDLIVGGVGADLIGGGDDGDRLRGGSGSDRVGGGSGPDDIGGGSGGDRLSGGSGSDRIDGGGGNDRIVGGAGADRLGGGAGGDRIEARDGRPDRVACGKGRDTVIADRVDRVARDCERVRRPARRASRRR